MYRTADVKVIIQNILIVQEFSCTSKFDIEPKCYALTSEIVCNTKLCLFLCHYAKPMGENQPAIRYLP